MRQSTDSIFTYHLQAGEAFFIPAISEEIKHKQVAIQCALALSSNNGKLLKMPRIQIIDVNGKLLAELAHVVPLEEINITQLEH